MILIQGVRPSLAESVHFSFIAVGMESIQT